MIPRDPEDLHVLAGEYVLGTLDEGAAAEIEAALAGDATLRDAVAYWQSRLHPLAALAPPAEPDPATWAAIAARIGGDAAPSRRPGAWQSVALWRWSAAAAAAIAAGLALYIALAPVSPAPSYVALLRAPHAEQAAWVAVIGRDGLSLRPAAAETAPPAGRAFELWAIARGATRPEPLGVVAANGLLALHALAQVPGEGATLAISVEPPGGSPTGQPTGPVVFSGSVSRSL